MIRSILSGIAALIFAEWLYEQPWCIGDCTVDNIVIRML